MRRALRERLDLAADELADVVGLRAGRLRLAAFPSAGSVLMPPAIAAFRERHPDVELSLEQAEPDEAADGLRDGRFDLAIVFEYDFEERARHERDRAAPAGRRRDARGAAAGSRARAARRSSPMARLAGETWVSSADATCNRLLTHGAGRAGFTPRVAFASDDYGAVGRLVIAGVGVALVPGARGGRRSATPSCCAGSSPRPRAACSAAVAPVRSAAADAMLALLTSASGRSTSSAPAAASA